MESQSLELSCSPQQEYGSLTGLHLYHRSAQSQTTLLSMAVNSLAKVDPQHRGRLRHSAGLDALQFNVTISHLQPSDTGLYMWELSYRENSIDQIITSPQKVFLFVERTGLLFKHTPTLRPSYLYSDVNRHLCVCAGRSCQCSPSYGPLILTIFTTGALLLITLIWLAVEKCVKARPHLRPQPPVPIYEEMTRKQQSTGIPQNNQEAASHLEEVNFPVYANPNIRQPQDNYYACPRQLALRA
ncbi:hypothetical protein GBF38_023154 [Nibea albiflora]|uniref:Uncharacterized protein n=1 Tax=Nibea albiflora TaxID=240163 RepID=A0ACB7EZE2_NIBAL|nr:hypothetical protein GBF38_023154 [Nibea albiflora]